MKIYSRTKWARTAMNTTEAFEGESIEEKIRRVTESNAPIEAVSPMIYTERKEGVRADTNIRTDKWDLAQQAMDSIAVGVREKRAERMNAKTAEPDASSKTSVPADATTK